MSSGELEEGAPFPIVVGLPYIVQKAVAGSGLPSSSSSDVVNFRHIRNIDLVYTSLLEANCRPPRVQASFSVCCVATALFMLFCAIGGCLSCVLTPLVFAEALLFCDPVTKLRSDDPVVPLGFCALFQVASGTVAMAVSVAVLGCLALNEDGAVGAFLFALVLALLLLVAAAVGSFAVKKLLYVQIGNLFSFDMQND